MPSWKQEGGNWTAYRELPDVKEVDFHWSDDGGYHDYRESMGVVASVTLGELRRAQEEGYRYVIFRHGWSTSRPGKTTARSQVRAVMRSPEATPYIIRRECIQHHAVFVAAIRPKPEEAEHSSDSGGG